MKTILLSSLLVLSIIACSKKAASCDDVYDHTLSLMPDGFKAKVEAGKADALAKCEKMSPETRQCALDATSMDDLMKCPRS